MISVAEEALPLVTPAPRFLSQDDCRALIARVTGFTSGKGRTAVDIESQWNGSVRWARNRIAMAGEWQTNAVTIVRNLNGMEARARTNETDAGSLRGAVRWAERGLRLAGSGDPDDFVWAPATQHYPDTHIWSDATYTQMPEARSTIANQLIDGAERAGMLSAGDIVVSGVGVSFELADKLFLYAPLTNAQCSLTVRDPKGGGSGWAGCSSYDWARVDAAKLAEVALDKCLRSRNPVAVEPGRYTTILEPQAAFELVRSVVDPGTNTRQWAESRSFPVSPYHLGRSNSGHTKLTQRVVDERVSLTFDPLDPDLGVIPFTRGLDARDNGDPMVPVTWIDQGVLTNLSYSRQWALENLHEPVGKPNSGAFRLSWNLPPASVDEMISTTTRGLLVTRFWGVHLLDPTSLLCTGMTRDGVWLIEHGKVSHPVKNMRFVESPLFSLNSLEQMGTPVSVFSPYPGQPALVPAIKVRDFSFTALVDAI